MESKWRPASSSPSYLRSGRPGGAHHELFLRASTPVGPLTHYAIGDLYQKRARQSGLPLQDTSSYCLRHSFAMRLLDRGVGVKVIDDLLGHRTLESTCVYLRLQTVALREVALPLPTATIGIEEDAA
ncbi:tyrosine-type recombinase/integrase [Bradyrhizobium yuanmingense]|uniref:tyrosine-type recombinase/integrase n=1 Tax=Bradyrhizobium yuanmingense TaxID=108015 RepID=UPI0035113BA6